MCVCVCLFVDFIYAHALYLILMKMSTGKCLRPLSRFFLLLLVSAVQV